LRSPSFSLSFVLTCGSAAPAACARCFLKWCACRALSLPPSRSKTQVVTGSWDEFAASNDLAFVDFFAPWCIWCQRLEPTWEKFAEDVEAANVPVAVAKVNCVAEPTLCQNQRIMAFPTLRFFKVTLWVSTRTPVLAFFAFEACRMFTFPRAIDTCCRASRADRVSYVTVGRQDGKPVNAADYRGDRTTEALMEFAKRKVELEGQYKQWPEARKVRRRRLAGWLAGWLAAQKTDKRT